MLLKNEFEVDAPIDAVWDYFQDVPSLAPCLPGAELTEDLGDDNYKGLVTSKVGPVTVKFGGTAQVVERDGASKRIVIAAHGAELKGKGTAVMNLTAQLVPTGRRTKVKVDQDLQLTGMIANFGRGMVADVMTVIMRSFATAVEDNIGRLQRGEQPMAAATSVGGVAIGIKAATLALKRVFGRLLGIRRWYEYA
ncbi:MAG TPA: SRPBCC family protein [Sporichthyaceae bacterium]|nr:SRPBCC family protein [Sporichthyaceae bacterium]